MARGRGDQLSWDGYAAGWAALHLGVDPRRSTPAVRGWLRLAYLVGLGLTRIGVPPAAVTATGVVLSASVPAVVVLRGWWFFAGAGLVLLAAVADSTDGAVAVISSRATRLGAFDDALADRVGEAAWLVAVWLVGGHGLVVAACGAVSWLHEYARARATVAGARGIGAVAVAERPTRVIAVIAALGLGGIAWAVSPGLVPGTVTVVLAVWVVLGLLGLVRLVTTARSVLRH